MLLSLNLHLAVVAEEGRLWHPGGVAVAFLPHDVRLVVEVHRCEQLVLDGREQSLAVPALLLVGVYDSVEPVLALCCL